MCIVCIDDDATLRWAYKGMFGHLGQVICYPDGPTALASISEAPSVVLCDLSMPYMDGYIVAEALKTRFPDTPVIIATALDGVQHEIAAEAAGYLFWRKCGDYNTLKEMVSTCLCKMKTSKN